MIIANCDTHPDVNPVAASPALINEIVRRLLSVTYDDIAQAPAWDVQEAQETAKTVAAICPGEGCCYYVIDGEWCG